MIHHKPKATMYQQVWSPTGVARHWEGAIAAWEIQERTPQLDKQLRDAIMTPDDTNT
ncbi:hypothetical protein Sjap_002658 [Stephania japonica]|uniref:Uncharacterized protein n=1 Tax=Stephania japonica TaxID=461633 RepID=A0AAP0KNU5_9MAGN